ncbi:MAG: c-type cytochrome [Chloracidobacterium sp.]|nr:c-type cytochrome [Chloracidobacterium sp.]
MSARRQFRFISLLFCGVFVSAATLAQLNAQEPTGGGGRRGGSVREFLGLGPAPDPAAAKKGEPIYLENCSGCHGKDGRGAQAPGLTRMELVLHDEKGEKLAPVLKEGRPGMPAFPKLSQEEVFLISQYLKMQIELAANRGTYGATYNDLRNHVTGDAKKGEAFFQANCASCHSATGDLAKIGSKFSQPAVLKNRFLWPATPGPARAKVITPDGKVIEGAVKTNNDFELSLVDAHGDYHYWPRNSVKIEIQDKLAGHRALLPKYSDSDINNITAYLVTLK